ncbi:hypothetical protein BH10BDE1_BH10BDE1_18490 [soil metagenome]
MEDSKSLLRAKSIEGIKSLSDGELLEATKRLVRVEVQTTTAILHHLKEIDARKLYAEMNCDSLFTYCTNVLKYSESQAHRRITAARLLAQIPDLDKKIEDGILTLTNIAQAQSFFLHEKRFGRPVDLNRKIEILTLLENQPTREAERILIGEHPEDIPLNRESLRFITPNAIEIKFILDPELLRKLTRIKVLLGHRLPHGNWADVVGAICDETLERIDPLLRADRALARADRAERRESGSPGEASATPTSDSGIPTTKSQLSRSAIPAATRHRVWQRDRGRCAHVDSKTGVRCNSTLRIEIDHIHPVALGGDNLPENLRLLCRSHNLRRTIRPKNRPTLEASGEKPP